MKRSQTQFDSTPELKKQIKLLLIAENLPNQTQLFTAALDEKWGDKYPDIRQACRMTQQQFAGKHAAV